MENEPTYFELLTQYCKDRGYNYFSTAERNRFVTTPGDPMKNKKVIYFEIRGVYFVAFDTFSANMGSTNMYCGLFTDIRTSDNNLFSAIKRGFLTNFLTYRNIKTGNSYVDKKLTVSVEKRNGKPSVLTESDVDRFLAICNRFEGLRFGISDERVNEVHNLSKKRILGLEFNYWEVDNEKLDFFIDKGVELLERIKTRL